MPNALEAQRLAAANRNIKLLILDSSAADRRSLQVALWFREAYPEIKVMVMSASIANLNYQLAESEQICLLVKPFTPGELAHMVRRVLE